MTQANYNLSVYRGDSKVWRLRLTDYDKATDTATPTDITDIELKAQCRASFNDYDVWHELRIVKDKPTEGRFSILISADESELLSDPYDPSAVYSGVWDLEMSKNGEVWTPLAGSFTCIPDVTRKG